MNKPVEFFYDYVSIYSYLADTQLNELKTDIIYRPIFLGGVMQATGNAPPATIKPKGDYLKIDADRWARRYGVTLRINPLFPQNTINALRVALVALRRDEFASIHKNLFEAMWVHQQNLSEPEVLASLLVEAGLDIDEYTSAIAGNSVKDELKVNTEEAVRRGAFGAPTFFVGDDMFFGNDRLDFVAEACQR